MRFGAARLERARDLVVFELQYASAPQRLDRPAECARGVCNGSDSLRGGCEPLRGCTRILRAAYARTQGSATARTREMSAFFVSVLRMRLRNPLHFAC